MFEMLIGLHVKDTAIYQAYRNAMTPLLTSMGGGFRYDFSIEKTLKSETKNSINRLFIIYFPSENVKNTFFNDKGYKEIKAKYFDASVTSTTIVAEYKH